jgi:hypothetical protein
MSKYAIIENEIVVNIIEADEGFIESQNLSAILETDSTDEAKVGGKVVAGKFTNPEYSAEQIAADEAIKKLDKEKFAELERAVEAKASALAKLAALGLSAEEIATL